MQATLHFDLTTPEDRVEFEAAVAGSNYRLALCHLDQDLRHWLKYGHNFVTPDEILEAARNRLYELMAEYRLDLEG